MGNSSVYKICTCEQEIPQQSILSEALICEDFEAFKAERWYKLQSKTLFDPNKFIFLYSNYKPIQVKLQKLWEIFDMSILKDLHTEKQQYAVISEEMKYAIRRGVPVSLYKPVIDGLFFHKAHQTCLQEYEKVAKKYQRKLKDLEMSFKKNKNHLFLNASGILALARIKLFLHENEGELQQNPYLQNFIAIFLIIDRQQIVYTITSQLIQKSFSMPLKREQSLRWHFTLNQTQFQKMCLKFHEKVQTISPTIVQISKFCDKIQISKLEIFEEVVGSFFFGFLPFQVILRVFIEFVNEGVRVLFRIYYAILKLSTQVIQKMTTIKQIIRAIRSKLLTFFIKEDNERIFFRYAFDLCLDSLFETKIKELELQYHHEVKKVYYLPEIHGISHFMSRYDFQDIWELVPLIIKHYDIKLIYSTNEDEKNVTAMVKAILPYNYVFILVESDTQSIFGAFLAEKLKTHKQIKKSLQSQFKIVHSVSAPNLNIQMLDEDAEIISHRLIRDIPEIQEMLYFGSSESFIFTLRPQLRKFHSSGQNLYFCQYSAQNFMIGGPPDSPALQIDKNLASGVSKKSKTYRNRPLNGQAHQKFKIKHIQCYCLY